jgi:hypothetical protein
VDRLDHINLAKFCSEIAEQVAFQAGQLSEENEAEAGALADYVSQLWAVENELREAAKQNRPLDWEALSASIGTDVIMP